jgi:hypothetical protein
MKRLYGKISDMQQISKIAQKNDNQTDIKK